MKKLELQTITVNIPESWAEVTLKQQMEVERLSAAEPDYKSLAIIAGYTGVELDDVKKASISDLKTILETMKFIQSPIINEPVTDYEHNGIKYSVIQSLMKGEAQDFISIETALQQHKDNEYKALPVIIAILSKVKREDGKYESISEFDIVERSKRFQDLPLNIANGIWFFFAVTAKLYTISPDQVLKQMDEHLNKSLTSMQSTLSNSVGGRWYIRWQKGILRNYLAYLRNGWNRYYSSINLDK